MTATPRSLPVHRHALRALARRTGLLAGTAAALLSAGAATAQPAASPHHELVIDGPNTAPEGSAYRWVARYGARPLAATEGGHEPPVEGRLGGGYLLTHHEEPLDLVWRFGDGTEVTTGPRASVEHAYAQEGEYTITASMRNREEHAVATARHPVRVRNRDPKRLRVGAVPLGDGEGTVELTASAVDVPGDRLEVRWSFGDGERAAGVEMWEVRHRYPIAGTYPVTVEVDDGEGGVVDETTEVVVAGPEGAGTGARALPPGDEPKAVASGFRAETRGAVAARLDAFVRAMSGVHLGPVSSGACRFTFAAWDPARLGHAEVILDLEGLRREGAAYTFEPPSLWVTFEATGEAFDALRKSGIGPAGRGLGSLLGGVLGGDAAGRARDELGIEPGERSSDESWERPAASPFGLTERQAFRTVGGKLELVFVPRDRATATFDLHLENTDDDAPAGRRTLELRGSFALDLVEAARDGMFLYDRCAGPGALLVESVYPEPGEQHYPLRRPALRVRFDRPYDPKTLDASTFQLGYPGAARGELVPVAGRFVRDRDRFWFVPHEPLLGGVRYEARVRTGPEGVRGTSGSEIPDSDGSGWHGWQFTTAIDFAPGGDGADPAPSLACHLYQSVLDAPLVRGKPGLARVYASWPKHPQVHPDAQVRTFEAEVILRDARNRVLSSAHHRFYRPDLWPEIGADLAAAEHTANVFGWSPTGAEETPFHVLLRVPESDGETQDLYRALCPTAHWERAPRLVVHYYQLLADGWERPGVASAVLPAVHEVARLAEAYAAQVFPVAEVEMIYKGQIRRRDEDGSLDPGPCDLDCVRGLLLDRALGSSAEAGMVVGFQPKGAGGTLRELGDMGPGSPAVIHSPVAVDANGRWLTGGDDWETRDRSVTALVHEMGHALWLEHLPYIQTERQQTSARELRDDARRAGDPRLWTQGIEGFRLAPDGTGGWNKSSTEGNGEGGWLVALMYPATIPSPEAFITRHHYLQIQRDLEAKGGLPEAGSP